MGGWVGGWMDEWGDGWMGGKVGLRIADSNQKLEYQHKNNDNEMKRQTNATC